MLERTGVREKERDGADANALVRCRRAAAIRTRNLAVS